MAELPYGRGQAEDRVVYYNSINNRQLLAKKMDDWFIVSRTTDYEAKYSDFVLADSTNNVVTVTLPMPSLGKQVAVKRVNASGSNVVINPRLGTIDDASSVTLNMGPVSRIYISDGNNWSLIASG